MALASFRIELLLVNMSVNGSVVSIYVKTGSLCISRHRLISSASSTLTFSRSFHRGGAIIGSIRNQHSTPSVDCRNICRTVQKVKSRTWNGIRRTCHITNSSCINTYFARYPTRQSRDKLLGRIAYYV